MLPAVYIRLYTDPHSNSVPENNKETSLKRLPVGELKMAAYLRATVALPLTTGNIIKMLAKRPLTLFSTMPRILYQAWILQFVKRLDVFPRPEPHTFDYLKQSDPAHEAVPGGGVIWQEETYFESFARRRVITYLAGRVRETGISLLLIPSNPNIAVTDIPAHRSNTTSDRLRITYLSPRFFTIIFMCPSAEHTLLFGKDSEGLFEVSSTDLFNIIFSPVVETRTRLSLLQETLQSFRRTRVPDTVTITSPIVHILDGNRSVTNLITSMLVLWSLAFLEYAEKSIFQVTGSRYVEGQEPWNAWERAAGVYSNKKNCNNGNEKAPSILYGSVRRDRSD
jgi:hypothetical protein